MSEGDDLQSQIREKFQEDTKSILEANLDRLDGMFRFHEDGTTELMNEYSELGGADTALLYLIAERVKYEGGINEVEDPVVSNPEFYNLMPDKDESTVRGYLMNLRQEGLARKLEDDGHQLVVERLPTAIDRIEEATND